MIGNLSSAATPGSATPGSAAPGPASGSLFSRGVRSDPRAQKLDRLFFRRLWALCRPYWTRHGGWTSWILLALALCSGAIQAGLGGYLTLLSSDMNNALVEKESDTYVRFFILVSALGFGGVAVSAVLTYLSESLDLDWRRWMTARLMDDYLAHRTYYEIALDGDIDNPDQRIQDQIEPFVAAMTATPKQILTNSLNIGVQLGILMSISLPMLVATFAYCAANAVVVYVTSKPLIRQSWDMVVAEADLRSGLLHVRDRAEMIAFHRGEAGEKRHLSQRLGTVVAKQLAIMRYAVVLTMSNSVMGQIWELLPILILTPLYFQGDLDFGTAMAATIAATIINGSMTGFINFIPQLTKIVPLAVRIVEIQEKFQALHRNAGLAQVGHVRRETGSVIGLRNVTLLTPGGERTLFRGVTAEVAPGKSLLVVGQTGVGKSSMLRAMAGLWDRGQGLVTMPPDGQALFLPQKPYMVPGSLRDQLLYPAAGGAGAPDDAAMIAALREAALEGLAERVEDLDRDAEWERVLSLGEQQRIAFARVFLSGARYLFLDEATSAVDIATERRLYQALARRNLTLVSVGHRPSLVDFHSHVLDLATDGTGIVLTVEQYRQSAGNPAAMQGPNP